MTSTKCTPWKPACGPSEATPDSSKADPAIPTVTAVTEVCATVLPLVIIAVRQAVTIPSSVITSNVTCPCN